MESNNSNQSDETSFSSKQPDPISGQLDGGNKRDEPLSFSEKPGRSDGGDQPIESWSSWEKRLGRYRAWLSAPEWALRHVNASLGKLAIFRFLELAGKLAIVVTAAIWLLERNDRIEARHNQAWSLIMGARGSSGDGGRQLALESLNKDGVFLIGAPLSRATFYKLDLKNAVLQRADFSGAHIQDATFRGADLSYARFDGATLYDVDFSDADLSFANFENADLEYLVFNGTHVTRANFKGAKSHINKDDLSRMRGCHVIRPDGTDSTGKPEESCD